MNPGAQRIAIAKALGLKDVRMSWHWQHGDRLVHGNDTLVPNYLTDLNAMYEAEKVLTHEQHHHIWVPALECICTRDRSCMYSTSASQRAEAFLRTLNLWEEN